MWCFRVNLKHKNTSVDILNKIHYCLIILYGLDVIKTFSLPRSLSFQTLHSIFSPFLILKKLNETLMLEKQGLGGVLKIHFSTYFHLKIPPNTIKTSPNHLISPPNTLKPTKIRKSTIWKIFKLSLISFFRDV